MDMFINKYYFYPNARLIGKKIKALRKQRKLTAEKLAEKLNYETKSINKWEQGRGLPSLDQIIPICKLLDTSVENLIFPNSKCIVNKDYSLSCFRQGLVSEEMLLFHYFIDSEYTIDRLIIDYDSCFIKLDYLMQKYISSWLNENEKKEFKYFFVNVIGYSNYVNYQSKKLGISPQDYIEEYFINKYGIGYKTNQDIDINSLLYELNKFITKQPFNENYNFMQHFFISYIKYKKNKDYTEQLTYMIKYLNVVEKDIIYTAIVKTKNSEAFELAKILKNNGAELLLFTNELDLENNENVDFKTVSYIRKINNIMNFLSYEEYVANRGGAENGIL